MFILTEKRGRKRYGIAGTECLAASCGAAASTVFKVCGFDILGKDVSWQNVEECKNYSREPSFKMVGCSERKAQLFWYKEALETRLYKDFDSFCDTFPEAREYEGELTA